MLKRILGSSRFRNGSFGVSLPPPAMAHDEYQYLNLINDILKTGEIVEGRNGDAKTIIGASMCFDLQNGTLPLLTTKRLAWKTCLKELLWFVRGETDNNILSEQNVGIWNKNSSREFLDSRGLNNNREGDLGPVYGHQWRHFNASYSGCDNDYTNKGVDQLENVVKALSCPKQRNSRRLIVSAWNPCQIDQMALPPCHILMHFNVIKDHLTCSVYQRSGDVGLGIPFNIASYSMLTHLIAWHCGLHAKEFHYYLGNCHIYDDHIEPLVEQTSRRPMKFPSLTFRKKRDRIDQYKVSDFIIDDYNSYSTIKMDMRQ